MNHKIKALGIVLTAMALTVALASTAQAQFTTSQHGLMIVSGPQFTTHKFTAGAGIGSISCQFASFEGVTSGTSEAALTVTPTYTNCTDSLGRKVDLTSGQTWWNGSFYIWINQFRFTFTTGASKGLVDLEGELQLTVTGSTHCTITIKGQTGKNGISYANESGDIRVFTETNNIHSSISGGFFACGSASTTSSAGTYTGQTFLGAFSSISID